MRQGPDMKTWDQIQMTGPSDLDQGTGLNRIQDLQPDQMPEHLRQEQDTDADNTIHSACNLAHDQGKSQNILSEPDNS